jgi:hypothetical protein
VEVILKFLNHVHELRKLKLVRCFLGADGTEIITKIVALYTELESLSLTNCGLLWSEDYCLIGHLKKLTELDIADFEVHYFSKPLESDVAYIKTCIRSPLEMGFIYLGMKKFY